nr:hypothetical protein [uncultured Desulfobulbus sp.]
MRRLCIILGLIPFLLGVAPDLVSAGQSLPVCSWHLAEEGLYVYRFDMDRLNWRQIRDERQQRQRVQESPKHLSLVRADLAAPFIPFANRDQTIFENGEVLTRAPDGGSAKVTFSKDLGEIVIPEDLGLNGRYLVGGHFVAGGNAGKPRLHLYPKIMVGHYRHDGRPGSTPAFFFNDPAIALEIGPARSPQMNRMGGGFQRPHDEYVMEVRYLGRPLAGATVDAIGEGSGWRREYRTDASGRFTVIPFDDRSRPRHYDKMLYVVKVEEPQRNALHIATLPMIIFRNRPEWTSHIWGYATWAGFGLAGACLLAGGAMLRNRRQQRQTLVRFDQCRIKEE